LKSYKRSKEKMEGITMESIFEMAQNLNKVEQWSLVEELLSHLKGSTKKGKKARDPEAPKRAMTPYMELLNKIVWPILKEVSEKMEDSEEKKRMRSVGARTQIASTIWDKKGTKEEFSSVTKEMVLEIYEELKKNPRSPKSKTEVAKEVPSPLSSEAEESASETPILTKKRAITKKVKEEDFGEEKKEWTYRNKKYMRLMNYLWDMEDKWVGEWDPATKKINREAVEPEIEYE